MIDTFVSFDIETTGLKPTRDKIIEIGALKVEKGSIVDSFHELINPFFPLPHNIIELTGINDSMLKEARECKGVVKDFIEFMEGYTILGHNVIFDYSFIKVSANRMNIEFEKEAIDTLTLSRLLHPEFSSRSLESMCNYYGINQGNAHRAYDDARATSELYFKLCEAFYENNSKLFMKVPLNYKIKKEVPITIPQKNYLNDLVKYHKIEFNQQIESLTKSEASRLIDKIILQYGRII